MAGNTSRRARHGTLTGASYSLGYRIPTGTMGLGMEIGNFDMDLREKSSGQIESFSGPYLLVGPSFNIPFGSNSNGHAFVIDLLAGTTTDKEIGLMSTMRLGLDFNMGSGIRLGVGFGVAVINVKAFKGLITDLDQINYLSGMSVSYRF